MSKKTKGFPRTNRGKPFESKQRYDYGLGLDVVVVVFVFVLVVSLVSFSLVFSVVGFTTVVLFSTFFSGAGEVVEVGATTVFSSQPPRSAAVAKMQNNFFIIWIGCPSWDNPESNGENFPALPKCEFRRQL
jgi:hypothetical protein